ncbi:hypothetical protein SteCoe_14717 [Stentor coeruleus]|uniref:Uncharacterized protein n=1 Tax=Stentor coeruleus TaxID=5963 RepID=A0A1R2C5H2_9CILI|nr:hypothetical protein SteCoe_14717 [Stentor coeruleus]
MIQETLNITYVLTCVYFPSYITSLYALLGLYLWLACISLNTPRKLVYKLSFISSLCLLFVKLLFFLQGYLSFLPGIYNYYKDYLSLLGVGLESNIYSIFTTFCPEVCICIIGFLGWVLPMNALLWVNQSFLQYLGIVLLWIMSCSEYSIQGVAYNCMILYWVVEAGILFISPDFKNLGKFASYLTTTQIFLSLTSGYVHDWLGYLDRGSSQYIIIVLGQIVFSTMSRETFDKRNQIDKCMLSREASSKEKVIICIMYFIGKICLFLWVDQNPGLTGLILILWFGFTLLEKSIKISMRVIKYLIVPLLIFSYVSSYLSCFWTLSQSYMHFFMLFTILMFSFLHSQSPKFKYINYSVPDTWYGRIVSITISHSYLLSLTVLFIIGLSAINLLHTGIMTFCMLFMTDVKSIKKKWIALSIYIISMLFIQETWSLVVRFIPENITSHKAWEVIGLNNQKQEFAGIQYDYLIWIQVFCCGLQLFANNYIPRDVEFEYTSTIFGICETTYKYFKHFQFWVLYSVILLVVYLEVSNILNFVRLVLILWILTKHLSNPARTIKMNFAHIAWHLNLLQYYSVILLAIRYLYQFLPYFLDNQNLELSLIGLGVYGKTELYSRTSKDTIILICSVLAHRINMNWAAEHNDKGLREENPNLSVSFIRDAKGGNNNLYAFFYNFLSRPFEYIVFLFVGYLCIYWKLSLATFSYLLIMGIYQFRVFYYFHMCIKEKNFNIDTIRKKEWKYRAKNWEIMFGFTIFTLLMAYARYLISENFINKEYYGYIEAVCFIIGYHNSSASILAEVYGFLVIFLLLVIERQCLEFIIPIVCKDEKNGWDFRVRLRPKELLRESDEDSLVSSDESSNEFDQVLARSTPRNALISRKLTTLPEFLQTKDYFIKKINYISVLALIKLIFDSLIPMFLLLLAFYKISVFSILYVLFVFIQTFFSKFSRTIILSYMLIIITLIEYLIIIANINTTWYEVPKTLSNIYIPISDYIPMNKETKQFFYLELALEEAYCIFYNILLQFIILIYYFHFSMRELQLDGLQKVLARVTKSEGSKEELEKSNFKTKFRAIIFQLKVLFYKFARFSIVLIVLMFITQSKGVLSSLYCLFCIIFLFQENSIYLSSDNSPTSTGSSLTQRLIEKNDHGQKGITFYTFLLGKFLQLISIDLVLQITIQIPYFSISDGLNWFTVFGLFKLNTNESSSSPESQYKSIYFKIFTFVILMLVHAMMKSKDFLETHRSQCQTIAEESQVISREMTFEFNQQRVTMHQKSVKRKETLEVKVRKLEMHIKIWNKRFYGSERRAVRDKQEFQVEDDLLQENWIKEKKPISKMSTLIQGLIKLTNPCLFKKFLQKINKQDMISQTKREKQNLYEKSMTAFANNSEKHEKIEEENEFLTVSNFLGHKPNIEKSEFESNYDSNSDSNSESNSSRSDSESKGKEVNHKIIYLSQDKTFPESKNDIYELRWTDYPQLICYAFASNTQAIVYFLFFVNHYMYASLESIVFPISVLGYAMLEFPRPRIQFFRFMLYYSGLVMFIKYTLQMEIWKKINENFLKDYEDPFRIGFNLASNTYSESLFFYAIWDVLVMFSLLCHEYYMLRIGMIYTIETDIESFELARFRIEGNETKHFEAKKPKGFFRRLMPRNTAEKPGKDLYLFTFIMQLIILMYLFIFFNSMDGFSQDIYMSIVSNQFQGRMVVSLLIVVLLILYDRYVYLRHTAVTIQSSKDIESEYNSLYRKHKTTIDKSFDAYEPIPLEQNENLKDMFGMKTITKDLALAKKERDQAINIILLFKLIVHGILLIGVHLVIFWYFPGNSNKVYCENPKRQKTCNDFSNNMFLKIFYVLYVLYLTIQAQQIRFGLPSFTEISFPLMRYIGPYTSGLFKFYRGAPFLFELRTVIDWTFTKTGLDIFQWFKFEDIQANLFTNQCTQKSISMRSKGANVLILEKCLYGACALVIMLLFILLPLLIFSTLNPIVEMNKVSSVSMSVKILIGARTYKLYSLSTADSLKDVDEEGFYSRSFNESSEIRYEDWKNMQQINMPGSADVNWDITTPTREDLKNNLFKVMNSSADEKLEFSLVLEYKFTRKYPPKIPVVSKENFYPLEYVHAKLLYNMIFNGTNETLTLNKAIYKVLRLPSAGDQITIYEIKQDDYKRDLILRLVEEPTEKYWKVLTTSWHDGKVGLRFYTISDTYSPMTFNFSIFTFYLSIVLLAGRLIRVVTYGSGMNAVMTDMKNAATLNTLCVAVYVSRMIGNISKEQEFYFELLDILRSPELIKKLTGSSSIKEKLD